MSERYSVLRPLTIDEMEWLTLEIFTFFSIGNTNKIRKLLDKPVINDVSMPLSVNDFYVFQEKIKNKLDIRRYTIHVLSLIKKLIQSNLLVNAGSDKGYSLGGELCYYAMKEYSNMQTVNTLWLGECLGLEYIQHKTKEFVVPITGIDSNGKVGIGTGTLINNNTILTCEHVLTEMTVDETIIITNKEIKIADIKPHTKFDVGIIKLSQTVDISHQIVFGDGYLLDEILTMGYPPIPMTKDAYIISQKGEINSLVQNYDGVDHFVYSSITRPGNSGGPIFSKRGHLVGISARHLECDGDKEKNVVPFYEGISSREVIKALKELEPEINIYFEDYQ